MAHRHREREIKLQFDGALPDLSDVRSDIDLVHDTVRLRSVYYDTPGLDLVRRGLTLRRREGDDDVGWQLKVPAGNARTELRRPLGDGVEVPEAMARLVHGVADPEELAPVATIDTDRRRVRVLRGTGLVLEIADDHVRARVAEGEPLVWREAEIEVGPDGDETTLAAYADALTAAGATPATASSKLARALGDLGDVADGRLADYLVVQVRRLIAGDVELRSGADAVHKTRVSTRRIRSVLRVFRDAFDGATAQRLDAELSWWQDLLGEVRDRQVQREHFDAAVRDLPDQLVLGPVRARIASTLEGEAAQALADVRRALDSERYRALLADVWQLATTAPASASRLNARASKARRKAARRVTAAVSAGDPALLHRARKATKRARYATELAKPDARKTIKALTRAQDQLGAHQDAVVAGELALRLARATAGVADENGFTFGILYQRERDRAADLRAHVRPLT